MNVKAIEEALFAKQKLITKTIIIVVVAIVAIYLYYNLKSNFQGLKNKAEAKEEIRQLETRVEEHEKTGEKATYTATEYENLANKLEDALDISFWGVPYTDDEAVFEVFNALKNNVDFLELKAAFGVRDGSTFKEWIDGDLDSGEKEAINQGLDAKGIIYKI